MRKSFGKSLALLTLMGTLVGVSQAIPSFERESGVRLSSAAPQSVLSSADFYRMYFIRDFEVHSATSPNQLDWTEESGVRLSSSSPNLFNGTYPITGCSVLPSRLINGFRMVYSVGAGTGPFGILIATSADGIGFGSLSVSTAVFISSGIYFAGSPRLTELSNGDWRLFFTLGLTTGTDDTTKFIYGAISTDEGASWLIDSAIGGPAGELALSTRTDQRLRMFYTAPLSGSTTNSTLLSGLSNTSVTAFTAESGVRFSTNAATGSLSSPVVVRSSGTDNFRYRLFYNFTGVGSTEPPSVYSAFTSTPDPQFISPSQVLNSASTTTFAISGEIFSSTPTVKLTKSGQSDIAGVLLSRDDDQTLSVSFNTFGAELGGWTVVVINNDGFSGSLTNGLTITFAPATVQIDDSLLRPRTGTISQINIDTFSAGHIKVRLFTMDGRLVKTLLDEERPSGTTTVPWDGKNAEGTTVASGTYLLTFEGPKLSEKKKIVVIR